MAEVKGGGNKITEFLDDLRNRRYWYQKEETEDLKGGNVSFSHNIRKK